jgi:hypothetical protein
MFGWGGEGEISREEYKKLVIEFEAKGESLTFDGPLPVETYCS